MSFFYSSTAGAVDFAALLLVCAATLYRGNAEVRTCSLVLLILFLVKRFALLLNAEFLALPASTIGVLAIYVITRLTSSSSARLFSALIGMDVFFHFLFAVDGMEWEAFTTSVTVNLYLQLALLVSGAIGNGLHDDGGSGGRLRPRYRRVVDLARWV